MMRAAVAQRDRERGLRIAPAFGSDTSRVAADRAATVSPDRNPRFNSPAARKRDRNRVRTNGDLGCVLRNHLECGNFACQCKHRRNQITVLYIVSESFEADL